MDGDCREYGNYGNDNDNDDNDDKSVEVDGAVKTPITRRSH